MDLCLYCSKDFGAENTFQNVMLGKQVKRAEISVHHFCLLFSNTKQTGRVYRENQIRRKYNNSLAKVCAYCRRIGATSQCNKHGCNISFHMPCGINHKVRFQYFGAYRSYCINHYNPQYVPEPYRVLGGLYYPNTYYCFCNEQLAPFINILLPCCRKWAHRECLQLWTYHSALLASCPFCKDVNLFCGEMLKMGIYIPEQDASWETGESYSDLYISYKKCDAPVCLHKPGRTKTRKGSNWQILICKFCGSCGCHVKCLPKPLANISDYTCETCSFLANKLTSEQS